MRWPSCVLATVVAFACASAAHAVVLCARQRADGTYNTTVKIREACKAGEDELNTTALGLQGPPGPQGPEGPQGPPFEVEDVIRFQNNTVALGEVIQFAPGDGFFMVLAGGGSHHAFGHVNANLAVTIIAQSGAFTAVQGTPGKFNVYATPVGAELQNLFEDPAQVALGLFSY